MKKFLLVTMIGLVLVMDIYGVIKSIAVSDVEEVNHIEETTTMVYVE